MLAAIQRQFPVAYGYGQTSVDMARATWKATDEYIRKNRNVLLAYTGAWILIITYFGSIHGPACALHLTKGMVVGSVVGMGLGISATQVLIPRYDAIEEPEESDGDSFAFHRSEYFGQIGRRPHLHTLGRAGYWALEHHLDAKVTRAVVLTIVGNTIFGAIPVFPGTLGLLAGIAMGNEIGYVASTDGEHTPDFSAPLNQATKKLQRMEWAIDRLTKAIYEEQVPVDIANRISNLDNSYVMEERGTHKFIACCNTLKRKLRAIQADFRTVRNFLSDIKGMTSVSIYSITHLRKIARNIQQMENDARSVEQSIKDFNFEWTNHKQTWKSAWENIRNSNHTESNSLFGPFDDDNFS